MPAVFDLALYGTLDGEPAALKSLSICTAVVLMGAYIGSLIYAFAQQKDSVQAHEGNGCRVGHHVRARRRAAGVGTVLTSDTG